MNILAIDYGEKNIGIAFKIGDSPIVPSDVITNDRKEISKISDIIEARQIDVVVIGMPYTLKNEIGPQSVIVLKFIDELKKVVSIPIKTVDERFTSQLYPDELINQDSYAAGEILLTYLSREGQ